MSDITTRRMLEAYRQDAEPTLFLSGFFQSPARNFHNSKEVEFDIVRSEEEVAIVIQDLSTGYRDNSADIYTNKSFIPPIFKEAAPINAFDLLNRVAGENPFEDPNFQINATIKAFDVFRKMERKIRRSIELQASQIFQTGITTLIDANGNTLYSVDFKAKGTHFPTAAIAWDAVGADPIGDLNSLAEVVRNDGLSDPDLLIMGSDTFEAFISNTDIQARFDNRRRIYKILKRKTKKKKWITFGHMGAKDRYSMSQKDYYLGISRHKFTISPEGNGIDSYRTWEALYLKSIPIVQKSLNMRYFKGLPILFTKDYKELTPEYLNNKYEEILEKDYNFDKLLWSYWKEKIMSNG